MSLEDRILKSMGNYNKQYVDSTNALAKRLEIIVYPRDMRMG